MCHENLAVVTICIFAHLTFTIKVVFVQCFIVLFDTWKSKLAIVLNWFQLVMLDKSSHLLDLKLADPILLLLFLELFVDRVKFHLAILDLLLPLPHVESILLVFLRDLLLKCKFFTL